ncbi:MAG: FAD-dependent oxidoreductase [Xanthobacteraceae bacterium]|nr:FAD-dependent oxidoreductase [Xanthobacteraceae bacterium]
MASAERYDVIVVGGGLAGLTAANRATQLGLRTAVLEAGADERYLCNTRYTMGFLHVAFNATTAEADVLRKAIEAATDGAARPDLAQAFAENVGRAVSWLSDQGIRYIKGGPFDWMNRVLAPPGVRRPGLHWEGRSGDVLLKTLGQRFKDAGGTLMLGTRAKNLMMDNGRCVGVEADRGAERIELAAGAVVLADGGFQANADLVRQHISPLPEKLCVRNAATGRGDGLQMAERVGAKLVGLDRFYGHVQCREALQDTTLWPYPILDLLVTAGIVVDRHGRRFADEGRGGIYMTNAIAALDEPDTAIVIFDDAIWNGTGREYILPPNPNAVEAGATLISRNDLGSLAQALDLPAAQLQAAVAAYNAFVQKPASAIEPPRSSRAARPEPIVKAPFHAFRVCAGITYTMGGVAVDGGACVLDQSDRPIAGLFAAGSTTGGLEGGGGPVGYIGGLAKALTLGLLAAESAAKEQGRAVA